jgi:3-oxoacyl-[acyl-carrier-protein] synthase-3
LRIEMTNAKAYISSIGMYVPEKRITNEELAKTVETSDEWIRERTGIRERRIVSNGQCNSDLSVKAIESCLEKTGVSAEEIDLIIVPTVTPDMMFPATACLVQDKLGASKAWGFDLSGACSGFLYALSVGAQFVENGHYKKVVVVGTDVMSSIVDPQDRATCVLISICQPEGVRCPPARKPLKTDSTTSSKTDVLCTSSQSSIWRTFLQKS